MTQADDAPALTITLEPRDVYGQTKFYPACDKSRIFAQLLGQATFTRTNLKLILALGCQINYTQREITL